MEAKTGRNFILTLIALLVILFLLAYQASIFLFGLVVILIATSGYFLDELEKSGKRIDKEIGEAMNFNLKDWILYAVVFILSITVTGFFIIT